MAKALLSGVVAIALGLGLHSYAKLHGDDWVIDLGSDAIRLIEQLIGVVERFS
ncbi:hypothetical protein ACYFX5_08930 [Bremerella sp. T1]|uniref:hypothetical protein n=1 Tax=Bremerella sp. TYQ1 TaxID=3119568 RepID=UPI001CCDA5DB|nr:hypothetical protein [Bremerella volcania]UBM38378.1 hypothetical protein LA756_10860 [Bremerella volcania]